MAEFSKATPAPPEETAQSRLWGNVKTLLLAFLLAGGIRVILVEAFVIEGKSMMPTLLDGDRVVVAKFPFGLVFPFTQEAVVTWGAPHLGDVVILNSPMDGKDIIKRVIGLPGDVVAIEDDVIVRNGRRVARREVGPCAPEAPPREGLLPEPCVVFEETLNRRTYLTSQSPDSVAIATPRRVPPGHVYVLGDHRDQSNDSRVIGPIPISRLKGRATWFYYPLARLGRRVR